MVTGVLKIGTEWLQKSITQHQYLFPLEGRLSSINISIKEHLVRSHNNQLVQIIIFLSKPEAVPGIY